MDQNCSCEYLGWDSDFFGRRIARVTVNQLTQAAMDQVLMWCKSNNIDCLYFLADPADKETVRLAEDNHFQCVDIRVTLEKQLNPRSASSMIPGFIRPCRPDDVPALRAVARVSHRDSRFYHDNNFPESLRDALYETWIDKSCKGYADFVLVPELEGKAVGYISCHLLNQWKGRIGLFALAADAQGNGLGQKLVNESFRWFAERGVTQVTVVTQGRNFKAQRFYRKSGFRPGPTALWYHHWCRGPKNKI